MGTIGLVVPLVATTEGALLLNKTVEELHLCLVVGSTGAWLAFA